ncbi:MAG TPA: L,D-transpeptidase [Opitutae bacterium]|nr:L,D-transpeptidase [Opitutae bacterium]
MDFSDLSRRIDNCPTTWIRVSIAAQALELCQRNHIQQSFPVSTSKKEPCNIENSFGTPRGLHVIEAKIGEKAPWGMIFVDRVARGKCFWQWPPSPESLITSRILRLRGLENGINAGQDKSGNVCDSFARYIYIHGTNREDCIGRPFSKGCVLLNNADMIDLFDRVTEGTPVWIF